MNVKEVTAKGAMPKVVMGAEGIAPEVAEVLAKVPKSPRMPRPKPTPTKESAKDKKDKQVAIPVRMLPRRNP